MENNEAARVKHFSPKWPKYRELSPRVSRGLEVLDPVGARVYTGSPRAPTGYPGLIHLTKWLILPVNIKRGKSYTTRNNVRIRRCSRATGVALAPQARGATCARSPRDASSTRSHPQTDDRHWGCFSRAVLCRVSVASLVLAEARPPFVR